MGLVLANRVLETTTTTGTGSITLGGTSTGYQSFSVVGNGNVTFYTITDDIDWEVGVGTYFSSGPTLTREIVYESSNSNNLVNWGAGEKQVFVTYPASQALYNFPSNVALAGSLAATGAVSSVIVSEQLSVEYLVVGGGGGGGGGATNARGGGGGGAGGYSSSTTQSVGTSTNIQVTVGAGGSGGAVASSTQTSGSLSEFFTFSRSGGGYGGRAGGVGSTNGADVAGRAGVNPGNGSGGGGADAGGTGGPAGTFGGAGGSSTNGTTSSNGGQGAGGGGSSGNGTNGASPATTGQPAGGGGTANSISGSSVTYSVGGAGGAGSLTGPAGVAGTTNRGNGGGGGKGGSGVGANGGSGIVILKYPDDFTISNPGGGLTFTTSTAVSGYKITTFTNGTGNIQFS
jgi:hypothetical protein